MYYAQCPSRSGQAQAGTWYSWHAVFVQQFRQDEDGGRGCFCSGRRRYFLYNRVCSEGREHRERLYSWTYPSPLLSSSLLHLAPGEPRPLSFFVGKIRQCSAFWPRCVTKTVGQVSCRVSCGRQGRRCWVGLIPHIFTQPPSAQLSFGAWSRKLICVTVIYAKETSGVFAFYGAVFVPRLFAPFRSPVRSSSRTTDSFGSGTA